MPERAPPSPWVLETVPEFDGIPLDLPVLDLACGGGRHVKLLLQRGHEVFAVDKDISRIEDLKDVAGLEVLQWDLEDDRPWPFAARRFKGVLVTNYLHRPTLATTMSLIAPGGALIYETFGAGNERFGRPSNPDFLAKPGEIAAQAVKCGLRIMVDLHIEIAVPRPAVVQRVLAWRRPS